MNADELPTADDLTTSAWYWQERGMPHRAERLAHAARFMESEGWTLQPPGFVTLPASVVRALLPENTEIDKDAVLQARRALGEADGG